MSRPWHRLVPDQKNEFAVAGSGPFATNNFATTAIASDRSFAMTYFPSKRKITYEMSRLGGKRVDAWWFNPRTGEAAQAGVFEAAGRKDFEPPGEAAPHDDWVLLLDDSDKKFPTPGKAKR